jgi:hypothetical protein
MASIPIPSFETMKKWFDYWRKFKGKRIQIYMKGVLDVSHQCANPLKTLGLNGGGETTYKMNVLENLIGTVADVVESPFGIMLKDVCIAGEETAIIDRIFIPMSEITKMYIFKKEAGQVKYDYPPKQKNDR